MARSQSLLGLAVRFRVVPVVVAVVAALAPSHPSGAGARPETEPKTGAAQRPRQALAALLDGAPFAASVEELRRAADEARADDKEAPVTVVLEDARHTFDDDGRRTTSYRFIYRIEHAAAVEAWASSQAQWAPWHQARPSLRARVIGPDGATHSLDPATIAEQPVAEADPNVYGDRMTLRAPLPAIAVGSIVEEEVVQRDTEPSFADGAVDLFVVGRALPMGVSRLVIDAPSTMQLRHEIRRVPGAAARVESIAGRTRLDFTRFFPDPIEDGEVSVPADVPPWPYIAFSTGRSWTDVASGYSAIVEAQLAGVDLRAEAKAATRDAKSPRDKAAALLALVRREVRYTGVEFGAAAIVPRTPDETRRRRYGDCKDQATLLVGLLRAAGLPAQVALMRAGFGRDVEEGLPGLGDFNHAVVYLATSPPSWIDPVAEYTRVGELPSHEQDRLALVVGASTRALVRTPDAASRENTLVRRREVELQESGPARAVELVECTGAVERQFRSRHAVSKREELEDSIKEYLSEELLADRFEDWSFPDPEDLAKPFTQRLSVPVAKRGATDDASAAVFIQTSWLLSALPDAISDDEAPTRREEFYFPTPFVKEYRYRIVPPPGFAPRPLPEDDAEQFGPALLTRSFRAAADHTVTVELRLDSGPRRISAAQFEAMRAKVREPAETPMVEIWFEQVGEAHLQAGRVREALAEFDGLVRLHPQEARHHAQRSRALLAAGLGEQAREAARAAVAVEPGAALAHRTLGWVLQHDEIGRRFKPGFDRTEAIAAYRKAGELDPTDAVARADLAILLEHDETGVRYGHAADLDAAIAEYTALRTDAETKDFDVNLMICLLRSYRFADLKTLLDEVEETDVTRSFRIIVTAIESGPPRALEEARRRFPTAEDRRKALADAAGTLNSLRQYEEAAAFLTEAARGATDASELQGRASLVGRLKRSDEVEWSPDDPGVMVPRFLLAAYGPGGQDRVLEMVTRDWRKSIEADADEQRELAAGLRALRKIAESSNLPNEVFCDVVVSNLHWVVDGTEASGFRVTGSTTLGGGAKNIVLFVVREDGGLRVAGNDDDLERLGLEAMRRLDAGDIQGARQWLDWARELVTPLGGDDRYLDPPFSRLWSKGAGGDAVAVRRAAAALAADGPSTKATIDVLERLRADATDEATLEALDVALVRAYGREERHEQALSIAQRFLAMQPTSAMAFLHVTGSLAGLGRFDAWQRAIDERLERDPDDPAALRSQANLSSRRGEYGRAEEALTRLIARGRATATDFNEIAWSALVRGDAGEKAIEHARRGVELSGQGSYPVLHTLAALYAEVGKTSEAYQVLLRAIDASADGLPHGEDWYVLGRMAEWYGLPQVARTCYDRVERPKDDALIPLTSYGLARRRLAAMQTAGGTRSARGGQAPGGRGAAAGPRPVQPGKR